MIKFLKHSMRDYLLRRFDLPRKSHGLPFVLWTKLPKDNPLKLVDVGAHNGAFTKAVERLRDIERGVLVEPIPSKAAMLREAFRPPAFDVFECLLGETEGTMSIEVNEAQATSSVLRIHRDLPEFSQVRLGTAQHIECRTLTLDRVVEMVRLDRIDLLKLDVQGFEDRVLRGGTCSLAKTNLIWTEVSFVSLYENSCMFAEVHQVLRGAGFLLLGIEPGFRAPDGELLQADALYSRKSR